ncbi:MAG: 2Fe-2S iron-sulfur cluster binding domain-containing protein [Brevibacillus sp.]|nr:2Fe-2S iron-sulfur cluster binding domain-containing protein [Brevibacillus sp.]
MKVMVARSADKGNVLQTFEICASKEQTVVEILETIQRQYDPTVAFSYSCRSGLCGTCIMLINGKPALGCLTKLSGEQEETITLRPLPGKTLISDLVVT